MRNRAFTVLELLVVIAVIGVLVALLIPGLDKVRERGLLTGALSNMHQIALAGTAYQSDFRDALPFTPTYERGSAPGPDSGALEGFCPWSFAGKNNDAWWSGRPFDIEATDRPLNIYLAPSTPFAAPKPPARFKPGEVRVGEMPIVRERGFEDSLQRSWPDATPGVTCYDDVGTSFLLNWRWFEAIDPALTPPERLSLGLTRLRAALLRETSRFVWVFDQSGDAASKTTDPTFSWNNAFDDDNKSVMGFADGHGAYVAVSPAKTSTPDYTLVLP